jgi:drug/metabolite transporter (DMT)-like permease
VFAPLRQVPARLRAADPAWAGFALGIFSAAVYTCANTCLRGVAHCDPGLVSCIKATPMMLLSGSMVVWGYWRRSARAPRLRVLAALLVIAIIAQLGGNVGYQIALGEIGLALGTALTFGALIIGGALVGRFWLGEPISTRSTAAMALLIGSIGLLCLAAPAAQSSVATDRGAWMLVAGVGAACASGLANSLLGAMIRRMARTQTPLPLTLCVISGTGCLGLGLASLCRLGWDGIRATAPADFRTMCGAGLFNAVAFLALSKSLERAPVVQVNAVNASQIAMAGLAGVIFFGEPASWPLVTGTLLTVVGLALVERSKAAEEPFAAVTASIIAADPLVGDTATDLPRNGGNA